MQVERDGSVPYVAHDAVKALIFSVHQSCVHDFREYVTYSPIKWFININQSQFYEVSLIESLNCSNLLQ